MAWSRICPQAVDKKCEKFFMLGVLSIIYLHLKVRCALRRVLKVRVFLGPGFGRAISALFVVGI